MDLALDALGVVIEVRQSLSVSSVASGYAAAGVASEGDLLGALEVGALSEWLANKGAAESALVRSRSVDGVFALDPEGFSIRATDGARPLADGRWIVDARRAPQRVLLERDATRLLLELGLTDAVGALLAPDAQIERPTPLPLPEVLSMMALLPGARAPRWLEEKHALLAGGSMYRRVVAVASCARLWPTTEVRAALGESALEQLAAAESPWKRAQSWVARLSPAQREAAVVHAQRECDTLDEELDALCALVSDEASSRARVATQWLERRDDLESVRLLLGRDEDCVTLTASIDALDDRARSLASTFAECAPIESAQLALSASEDPGSWWTELP